jgi:hypothetical protein
MLTSTSFNVQALTSHSRCGIFLTSSSMNKPSDWIFRIRPSVTLPTLDTSCATGFGNRSLKRYTALICILSGSLVEYGARWLAGGDVRAVDCEAA